MSRSTALIIITAAFALGVGVLLYLQSRTTDAQMKDLSLKPSQQIVRHTAKLTSQLTVGILNLNNNYKPALGESISLKAQINLQAPATKLDYQWILPAGLVAQAGQALTGQINIQNWQYPQEIQLQLINQTPENQKVFLRISASGPNQSDQIASAQYDTQNFLELKQEQEDLMKRQDEYLQNLPDDSKKFK